MTYILLSCSGNYANIFSDCCRSKETNIVVAHDWAIPKMAMQIQHEKIPKYSGVFIALGAFQTKWLSSKRSEKY